MLIKNREQQEEMKIRRHQKCTRCTLDLDYPRIVLADANATSYHIHCALQIMVDLSSDLSDFITSPDLTTMANRIATMNIMQKPLQQTTPEDEEQTAMAKAFQAARQYRKEEHDS